MGPTRVSKYYVDKFLYRVDRDSALLQEYMREPAAFVPRWENGDGRQLTDVERTSSLHFTDEERRALVERDIPAVHGPPRSHCSGSRPPRRADAQRRKRRSPAVRTAVRRRRR